MNQEYLCQVCGAKCDDPCFPCRCAAIYFCSEAHRHRSASASFSSSSQHTDLDCVRFAEQLSRGGAELDSLLESVLGKSFSSLTPPRDACSLLEAAGVHGKGLFASCCPCGRKEKGVNGGSRCWPALPPATAAALPSLASLLLPLFLPGEEERTRHLASSAPPKGWREYLVARGLLPSLLSVASSETAAGSSSSAVAASPSSSPSPPSPSPAQFKEAAAAMTLLHRPLTASLTLAAAGWWSGEGGARIRGAGGEKRAERGGRSGAGRDDEDEDENDDDENGDNENDDASGGDETETPPRPFVLHVVGASVDTEVAQWPVWLELAALGGGGGGKGRRRKRNPHESLVVALVGPTVPVSLDRAAATFPLENSSSSSSKTITIRFARGRYHDVSGSLGEEADAVFAPDAVCFFSLFFTFGVEAERNSKKTHSLCFDLDFSISKRFPFLQQGIAADFDGWRETVS